MLLALDTSSAACSAALFDAAGTLLARRDEVIGRGHSERLVPLIEELLEGRVANRILVGVGPGSFTGIRVGIAAAHGLAIGWSAEIAGMSSLALLAASVRQEGEVAAAIIGGHGELFVQQFDAMTAAPASKLLSLVPAAAAAAVTAKLVIGSGAGQLVAERGWGEARDGFPAAADALRLPEPSRTLAPSPVYARAPDARPKVAA
ncbi:MAG: tRNA (adenosine(37)-N6)-threonylcarbamoyltransferase complex dimerization subunit type 1 TsaB [Sphingomicrobium sp.]